jgi:hypothetical protein
MTDIKAGSVWRRTSVHGSTHDPNAIVTAVKDGRVYYVYESTPAALPFNHFVADFLARFIEVTPPAAPQPESWDYAEADRLRKAAAAALAEYNAYAERKPTTAHYSIAVPWELKDA